MKILMATMSLDIGGAETHILELSTELASRGYDVTIASNGGAYVKELEAQGIKHVTLPLHNKHMASVVRSYFGMKKLIKREKYDVVHAHARIPAFICGMLEKRLHFRFVTTAHLTFNINFLWKKISAWGEHTLAVSEDIKDYLIKNYSVYPDNIDVTINGINKNRFSDGIDYSDVAKEFGLDRNKRHIVYISRIDSDRSAVAFMLAEVAPKIYKYDSNIEIVIVGGGNDFTRLSETAGKANAEIGSKMIKLTGARTDINKFISYSDIFIGVSRAALEAMCAGKPVIVAGNEGYIGFFDESKQETAVLTNFCCRGCRLADKETLYNEIIRTLNMPEEELKSAGKFNYDLVDKYYSISQMADDAEKMYSSVMYPHGYKYGDVIISGYYGFGNLGDESLLRMIIKKLREKDPELKITVLSKTPKLTSRTYGVKSISRLDYPAIISACRHGKLLISGGGSLLQNSTSMRSLLYYISIMNTALRNKMKLMLYASGIGPLNGAKSVERVKNILERTDVISLRESVSEREILDMQIESSRVYVSADPAFCIDSADPERVNYILNRDRIFSGEGGRKIFIISLREWSASEPDFERKMADACVYIISKYGYTPVFVSLQNKKDIEICFRIRSLVVESVQNGKFDGVSDESILSVINAVNEKNLPVIEDLSASELVGIFGSAEFVIGMRLHSLIYAAVAGIPVIGLSYDPKITSVMTMLKQNYFADVKKIDYAALCGYIDEIVQNKEKISRELRSSVAELKERCAVDAETAIGLIK